MDRIPGRSSSLGGLRSGLAVVSAAFSAFGWRGAARRLVYVGKLRTGALVRSLPVAGGFDGVDPVEWTASLPDEWFDRLRSADADATARLSTSIISGEIVMFGGESVAASWPPAWHRHPVTDVEWPRVHWTALSDDDPAAGDIKDLWELSRFGFTFDLARASVLGDSTAGEQWWTAVEDWAQNNPPNVGVNWKCAQESSLRAIAWCFGSSVFASDPATTPDRRLLVGSLLAVTRERVEVTLGYALSQRNNHAVSELCFLLSLPGGVSARMVRLLREVVADQFFDDGSYAQQSAVYHRLAVHALLWLVAVQPDLPADMRNEISGALARSRDFLQRVSDPISGEMPNYGANDGSELLRLEMASHLDIRPTLRLLDLALSSSVPQRAVSESSYHVMRSERLHTVTRIGSLGRRAAHADQQAIEVFVDGCRVVVDPGSYRYSGSGVWRNPFVGDHAHSGPRPAVAVARGQFGRFLRVGQPDAAMVLARSSGDGETLISRREDGVVTLDRSIVRVGERLLVVDRATGGGAIVRWNLRLSERRPLVGTDFSEPIALDGGATFEIVQGAGGAQPADDERSAKWSPTYGTLETCASIEVPVDAGQSVAAVITPAGLTRWTAAELADMLSSVPLPLDA